MWNVMVRFKMHIAALLLLGCQTAVAETFVCDEGICFFGPTDVLDNVIVEGQGTVLLLEGTTVLGNIHLRDGGSISTSRAWIGGNVISQQGFLIDFAVSTIEGNLEVNHAGGEGTLFGLLPTVGLFGSQVGGNVEIKHSDMHRIQVLNSDIGGNLQVNDNVATISITITNNFVGGNLQCRNNSPPPIVAGNVVAGNVDCDCCDP